MPTKDIYNDKYVVFLDILGFKAKVEKADADSIARQDLLNALKILRDTLCNYDEDGIQFTHFSDCIIFSANRTSQGLWETLESIKVLTINLLNYDFLVRGGLAVGGAHHDQNFVYGTAVNRAYYIENKKAVFPMTLVCDEVIADAKAYGSQFAEYLTQDKEGHYFVHYLKSYAEYTKLSLYPGKIILDYSGRRIIDFICHRLNTDSDPKIRIKENWFKDYWNETVATQGVFGRIEAGVKERDSGNGPILIERRRMSEQPEIPSKHLKQVGEPTKYIARNTEYEINICKITIPSENKTHGYRAYISTGGHGIETKNNLFILQETRDECSIITELISKARCEIDNEDNLEIYPS